MRRRPWALACLVTALLPAAPAAASGCAARTAAIRYGRWFTSRPPLQPRPAAHQYLNGINTVLEAVAIDPADGRIVLASDGLRLYRSDDGGCHWAKVYELPDTPGVTVPDGLLGSIEAVHVARVNGRTRVILAVHQNGYHLAGDFRTVIVRSDDGYSGWTVVDDPVSFAGAGVISSWRPMLRGTGNVVYAVVPWLNGLPAYVRSVDGGRTWSVRSRTTDVRVSPYVEGVSVNPWYPDELWEWNWGGNTQLEQVPSMRRSTDGGATWTPYDPWPWFSPSSMPSTAVVDVAWPRRGGPARLLVLGNGVGGQDDEAPVVSWSGDGGATFRLGAGPSRLTHFAFGALAPLPNGDAVFVANNRFAWRIVQAGRRAPRAADWRVLRSIPVSSGCSIMDKGCARATVSSPTTLSFPTTTQTQFLVVR